LGYAQWEARDLPAATETFRKVTVLRPTLERASLSLFHVLWEREMPTEAWAEARRFLELAPSDDYRAMIAEVHAKLVRDKD
jgi:hypothetical protein